MVNSKVGAVAVVIAMIASQGFAETQKGTSYKATIWVDPDGCQHWVIDTGIEGFMSQRLDGAGKPVCNKPLAIACADPTKISVVEEGSASCR